MSLFLLRVFTVKPLNKFCLQLRRKTFDIVVPFLISNALLESQNDVLEDSLKFKRRVLELNESFTKIRELVLYAHRVVWNHCTQTLEGLNLLPTDTHIPQSYTPGLYNGC